MLFPSSTTLVALLSLTAALTSAAPAKKAAAKKIKFVSQKELNSVFNFDAANPTDCQNVFVGVQGLVDPKDVVNKNGVVILDRVVKTPDGSISTGLICTKPVVDIEGAFDVATCRTLGPGKGVTCVKQSFRNKCFSFIFDPESGEALGKKKCDNTVEDSCTCDFEKI
ncbi:hypothetical protein HDU97_004902 [Phlyctochytrium planicorne]|nr:hypothetical protein HDU97_004902 [Phlyctochytrium planicorne]